MIKRLLLLIAIIASISSRAQTFPYLNASTGNENEFPVDKDTNIYMFHGDRLVKTDKNFNVIWAKNYANVSFRSLLLSKTGSIYFTGSHTSSGSLFGKLSSNGNLVWVKSLGTMSVVIPGSTSTNLAGVPPNADAIILDRNNNLLLSGAQYITNQPVATNAYFLKIDTNGTIIKYVPLLLPHDYNINNSKVFKILSDSSGVLKFATFGTGYGPGGSVFGLVRYSDLLDTVLSTKVARTSPSSTFANKDFYLVKSRFNSDCYISMSNLGIFYPSNALYKFDENFQIKWGISIPYSSFSLAQLRSDRIEEGFNEIFYPLSNIGATSIITNGYVRVSANGIANNYLTTMLSSYSPLSTWGPTFSLRYIEKNRYYFDATGWWFPSNPLTIQKIDSSLVYSCSNNHSVTTTTIGITSYTYNYISQKHSVTSVTIPGISLISNSSTLFVDTNFCLITNLKDYNRTLCSFSPNPAHSKIVIHSNEKVESVEVYDISGKLISTHSNSNEIDVSGLTQGMYFLRMNFGNEIVTKKFIKN